MFIKTYNVDGNNLNEFNDNVKQGTGMVAYTADWCGHCKNLKPHWDKFQNRCKRKKTIKPVTVAHCDVPKYQSQAFGANTVRGFPTIIAFKDGKEVSRFSQLDGNRENPKDLEKFLNKFIKMNKKRGRRNSVNNTKKKKKKRRRINDTNTKKKRKKKRKQRRKTRKLLKNLVKRLGY
jgi:thioredoxin-like negative regulator of GroEL